MFYDSLTGLPNAMLFLDRLQQAVAHAARRQQMVALLYMDIDGFKRISERHGVPAGDRLMQEIAERLGRCIQRKEDTLARLCGDQFAMVLGGIDGVEGAMTVLGKVDRVMKEHFLIGNCELSLTLSVGASIFPDDGKDWSALLRSASIAMHQAKSAGGGSYCCYGKEEKKQQGCGAVLQEAPLSPSLFKKSWTPGREGWASGSMGWS